MQIIQFIDILITSQAMLFERCDETNKVDKLTYIWLTVYEGLFSSR